MWLFNLKNTLPSMKKKPHDRILKEEPKKQHLSIVPNAMFESLEEDKSRRE